VPPVLEPWEVFRREKDGDPMRHGGSVMAPDAELAVHYARELYGRRQESERLWVVRRADIHDLADLDLLQPPLDRSYKKPGGYVMRDKLAAARERSGTTKPPARERTGTARPANDR
jgi:phenylacetate-CoA oxygenase PaaH subunit